MPTPVPIAILLLTLSCILLWLTTQEKLMRITSFLTMLGLPHFHYEDLCFTGNSLFANPMKKDEPEPVPLKIHTLFTATFLHATRSHMINNMLMLYGIAEFEANIGFFPFIILFLTCGAVGWLVSLSWRRWNFPDMWYQGIVQFQDSSGASPATYGVVIAASVAMGNEPIGNAFGLSPSTWVWLLLVLPKFCGNRFEVNLMTFPTEWTLNLIGISSTVLLICYASSELIVPGTLTADRWMTLYLCGNYLISFLNPKYLRREKQFDVTDHASHFGGAIFGFCFGTWLSGSEGLYRVEVWLCMLWLAFRVVFTP